MAPSYSLGVSTEKKNALWASESLCPSPFLIINPCLALCRGAFALVKFLVVFRLAGILGFTLAANCFQSIMDNPFFENIPLMEPPPGQVSNFNNPPSQGIIAVVVGSICMGLVWPVFVLRIYAKVWVTRAFWWDDCKWSRELHWTWKLIA